MTKDEFIEAFRPFAKKFDFWKFLTAERISDYFDAVKDYEFEHFKAALKKWCEEKVHFPAPVDLRHITANILSDHIEDNHVESHITQEVVYNPESKLSLNEIIPPEDSEEYKILIKVYLAWQNNKQHTLTQHEKNYAAIIWRKLRDNGFYVVGYEGKRLVIAKLRDSHV